MATVPATATAKAFKRLAPAARMIDALCRRAGGFISFARPKETNQRKGRPAYAPRQAGVPSLQTIGRWLRNSLAALTQTVLAEFPPACLPLGAAEGPRADHPLPRPLPLKGRGDACDGQQTRARLLLTQKRKTLFVFSNFPPHPTGVPPVTWRRGVERDLRLATDVGHPGGAQTRGSFSLVRFFWRSKRNEPARPVAKGIKQPAPQALGVSGVAVAVVVAVTTTAATPTKALTKATQQPTPRAQPASRHAARRPRPTAQVSP
ncbi:hypothetical protein GCM10007860_21270 [Chitiniphilus shinanonensis]|uniref:Uncharacterized protein n=1 Tax=Chitiniphilus shinanonensis TaxID=553088 RepID=A0ABQ6BTK0_9NEIS|nr:hypothetical protein GCM10007860_21270 [Chitiniphilus shinanonensis]